jgi:CheY-like chemotaxis protein
MAKILIVDDEPFVRESMGRILERAGHTVTLADCGAAGMHAYEDGRHDLVITDVIMPGEDGVDFIRRLRASGCTAPIVAISGGGNLEPEGYKPGAVTTAAYLAAATNAGANSALIKPFDRKQLLGIVESVLPA